MRVKLNPERIRRQLRPVRIEQMFRVIHHRHRRRPLSANPTPSRFSDPNERYAVLYGSEAVRCSFWEALVRGRFTHSNRRKLSRSDVEARRVVSFSSTETLILIDLRDDGPIRIGAPTAVTHDTNHAAGRALSATTYAEVPEADGILYQSRFTGHLCVAVFDRAFGKLKSLNVTPLVEHADFLDSLDDYDITFDTEPN